MASRTLTSAVLVLVIAIGAIASQDGGGVFFEGGSLWMANSTFHGTSMEHRGDAKMVGLLVGFVSSDGYWGECSFITGERNYASALDTRYFRNATGFVGLSAEFLDAGIGLDWQASTYYYDYVESAWGPLGVLRFHHPLSDRGVEACVTASLCPIRFGEFSLPFEYAQLRLSLAYRGGLGHVEVGYQVRTYYNSGNSLRFAGPILNLSLSLSR